MKKRIIITLTFLLSLVAVKAQTITNIVVSQGTGEDIRLVDILFDLSGNDATYNITLEVSFNDGTDYVAIDNANVTGDLTVAPGTGINLVWDGSVNYSEQSANFSRIKITATTCTCGTAFVDARNGQSYTTVLIGTQCWMAENLNIGTRINGADDQTDNSTIEKYCYGDDDANCTTYGGLYQWDEIMQYVTTEGTQGICPEGWHLPTDDEWKTMEMALGMSQSEADDIGWRGIDEGYKMKSTSGWSNNGNGSNSSGFTALPGGLRTSDGSFYYLGYYGLWWSSSEYSGTNAWYRYLYYGYDQVSRGYGSKPSGFSVRCLKN